MQSVESNFSVPMDFERFSNLIILGFSESDLNSLDVPPLLTVLDRGSFPFGDRESELCHTCCEGLLSTAGVFLCELREFFRFSGFSFSSRDSCLGIRISMDLGRGFLVHCFGKNNPSSPNFRLGDLGILVTCAVPVAVIQSSVLDFARSGCGGFEIGATEGEFKASAVVTA